MKLAFVAAANSPHTVKWVNAMADAGHAVSLCTLPGHQQNHGELREAAKVAYLPQPEGKAGLKPNAAHLKGWLHEGRFDAVIAMDMMTYGLIAAKAKAGHLLLVSSGTDIYNMQKLGTKSAVMASLKCASAVCATAPNVITKIRDLYRKEKPFFVTPFGVDMERFCKKPADRSEGVCFGSLRFLEHHNGVDLVIDAFSKFLAKTSMVARLKIAGGGSMEDSLKKQAQDLGIGEMVEFTGYVKNADMPDVINTMDVVVQMAPEDCFGVSGVEAMACGVPVISSDAVGASEYILNGVTGYLVKAGNTAACAERMIELAKNPGGRERMGAAGREDMLPLYDLKDCVKKFEEALRAAMGVRAV